MKYILDTDKMTITKYEEKTETKTTTPGNRGEQMVAQLEKWKGAHEWDSIVAGIQNWYYGYMSKTSWCSTTISFLLTAVGIQVRRENVKLLYDYGNKSGIGRFYTHNDIKNGVLGLIKRGDILFFLWDGDTMETTSSKHVTMCEQDSDTDKIICIGGNQSDGINPATYNRKYLYGVWRLD